jgi:mRNA interferase YafQ
MRTIEWATGFKRDFKREKKKNSRLESTLGPVLSALAQDRVLELKYRDHAMIGNWQDFRNCHVKPDLVLIYQKLGEDILLLTRLGSHSELGI